MLILVGLLVGRAFAAPSWECSQKQVATFNEGVAAYNEHRFDAAVSAFRKVSRAEPECGRGLLLLGVSLDAKGDEEAGLEALDRAAALFPRTADIEVARADALFVLQRFDEAAVAAGAALAADPSSANAMRMAVRAAVRRDKTDEALQMLDSLVGQQGYASLACQRILVLENAHRDDEAAALLGVCKQGTDAAEIAEATARVARSADAVGDAADGLGADAMSRSVRAASLASAGRYAEAEPIFRALLEENPEDAVAQVNLAVCLYGLGREAEGQREMQRVFSAGTWVRREGSGAISGIISARGADELEVGLRGAIAGLVLRLVDGGDLQGAAEAQRKAEERFGRAGPLVTSAAALGFANGSRGWELLLPVLADADAGDRGWDVAGDEAFAHPDQVPQAAVAAIVARGTPEAKYNLAAGLSNANDDAGCLAALAAIPEPVSSTAVNLGYACAIGGGDDATLEAWRERARRTGEMRFRDAYSDAVRAFNGGDFRAAMQRLNSVAPDGPEHAALVADMRVVLLTHLGSLDEARKLVDSPGVAPESVYNLGVALQRAGRDEEAIAVVKQACVGAKGELAGLCIAALRP